MSNAQPPYPGQPGNSPWASQDPNWRPSSFHDAAGRDPRQPFGQPAAPPPSGPEWEPPQRSRSKTAIIVAVVGVIAALIVGMQFLGDRATEPVATASPSAAAQPTATRTGNYIPFEGNGNGVFEIVRHEWRGDELQLRIRVEVERGEYGFGVFGFTNASRQSYDPIDPSPFVVREGEPFERDFTFVMPQEDSTIVLTTQSGRIALNALPVDAN